MKNTVYAITATAILGWSQASVAGDTWAFDGSEEEITQLAKKANAIEASKKMYTEVYQNKALCWSWDACADKPRVYGQVYDTYSFE
ncbi:MAG: hypothetical protein JXR47_07165 [Thiotrichales bacterium]|nr:hypothetical protein [Thiotrichales bacterium]